MIWYQIAVLEEQRNEAEDEAKASDKPDINNDLDDKPDINDVPMEESQVTCVLIVASLPVVLHLSS